VAAALMLAACGSSQAPSVAASAESIEQAVSNAERELAQAKAGHSRSSAPGLFGA
jgi:hypothetical protein